MEWKVPDNCPLLQSSLLFLSLYLSAHCQFVMGYWRCWIIGDGFCMLQSKERWVLWSSTTPLLPPLPSYPLPCPAIPSPLLIRSRWVVACYVGIQVELCICGMVGNCLSCLSWGTTLAWVQNWLCVCVPIQYLECALKSISPERVMSE